MNRYDAFLRRFHFPERARSNLTRKVEAFEQLLKMGRGERRVGERERGTRSEKLLEST